MLLLHLEVLQHPSALAFSRLRCGANTFPALSLTWTHPDPHLNPVQWCIPDNITHPTSCINEGTLQFPNGTEVCRSSPIGGVHSVKILQQTASTHQPRNNNNTSVDLLLLFAGGAGFDAGQTAAALISLEVRRGAVESRAVEWWGTSLWTDTVAPPHNAGLDHAWQDEAGHVWVTTFRKSNPGLHLLTRQGQLLLSVHGLDRVNSTDDFRYPSGVHGVGRPGLAGSWIAVTTSSTQWRGGHGALFLMDISDLHAT